jgi:hypothetical protein
MKEKIEKLYFYMDSAPNIEKALST